MPKFSILSLAGFGMMYGLTLGSAQAIEPVVLPSELEEAMEKYEQEEKSSDAIAEALSVTPAYVEKRRQLARDFLKSTHPIV